MKKTLQYLEDIGISDQSRTKLLSLRDFLPHLEELLTQKQKVITKTKVVTQKKRKTQPMKAIIKCNVYTGEPMDAYRSISEAANDTGVDRKTIRRAVDSDNPYAKNFLWKKVTGFTRCMNCGHINITSKQGKIARTCENCSEKMTFARVGQ